MVWSPWESAKYRTLPYDTFYSKLGSLAEAECIVYVNLFKSRLTTKEAVFKLKLSKPLRFGIENY